MQQKYNGNYFTLANVTAGTIFIVCFFSVVS